MEQPSYRGQRFFPLDAVRTLAIALMVFFHTAYDLNSFGMFNLDFQNDWFWWGLPRLIVFLFLWAVGVSLCLVHFPQVQWQKFWRRFGQLAFFSFVISLATYFIFPTRWIYFGTLHCIATCSLMAMPFLGFPKISLLAGSALLIAATVFNVNLPWFSLAHWSMDYIPVFPWFGVVLLGIFSYHRGWHKGEIAPCRFSSLVHFCGKHSLSIYLIHQPVIYGALFVWFYFFPIK